MFFLATSKMIKFFRDKKKKITQNKNSRIWAFSLTSLLYSTELHLFQKKNEKQSPEFKKKKKKNLSK